MLDFLQRPYPFDNNLRKNLTITFSISIFVFAFLFIFQPFGLRNLSENHKIWVFLGFSFVTFFSMALIIFLIPAIFPKFFEEEKWTVLKEIIFMQLNVTTISFGNYFFSYYLGFHKFTLQDLISNFVDTFAIGVFPVTFLVIFNYIKMLKKNLKDSKILSQELAQSQSKSELKEQHQKIILSSENGKDEMEIDLQNLLFVESTSNYVVVKTKKQTDKIQETILRSSLTRIEKMLTEFSQIFRCHRTYLVNIQNVKSISGNSQGYKLIFEEGIEIPVSRSKAKKLKELLA